MRHPKAALTLRRHVELSTGEHVDTSGAHGAETLSCGTPYSSRPAPSALSLKADRHACCERAFAAHELHEKFSVKRYGKPLESGQTRSRLTRLEARDLRLVASHSLSELALGQSCQQAQ